ncbi:glycoside hydrolase family 65 protein [Listeria monocytogenes]
MAQKQLFEIEPWTLRTTKLDKENKRLQESLTSLGNGYMGMRGNFEEGYSGDGHIGTYYAGVWFPDKTRVGWWKNGYPDYFGKVINGLNFIGIEVRLDGEKLDLFVDEVSDFELELDMEKGVLRRQFTVVKNNKIFRISAERFLSVATKELAVIHYQVEALSSAKVELTSFLDGNVQNEDANYEEMFWQEVEKASSASRGSLVTKTIPNNFGTPRFTVSAVMENKTNAANETNQTKALYTQQGIRFNIFQLFATYYGEDARLNIGPKGFTGEKYGGATYWDTEAFALPMYLSLTDKSVSHNLLKYRHDQLDGAKINAQKIGLDGALYPMVTFTGVECHNEWEITFEEIHRNGAIAYAIYNYTNYTGDDSYLKTDGIEVLTEITRFWADRVHLSDRLDKYMIHGVTGPNEYDNNVSNNWYTNYIAAWTIRYTLENLDAEAKKRLGVTEYEIAKWEDIEHRMYYPFDEKWQIFVQHDTFLDKELRSTDTLKPEDMPINQNWSWDKILRSCFIKQADVLQGLYLFYDDFDFDTKQRNFEFYEPLTVHESSLSPAVHAVLASELGKYDKAVELYKRTARLDLDNINNDTEDGLHITSMAGSWLSIVQGFAGMRVTSGKLSFAPFLPNGWDNYRFKINFRDRLLEVKVEVGQVTVKLCHGEAINLEMYKKNYLLETAVIVEI